jgi:hypothetical protein
VARRVEAGEATRRDSLRDAGDSVAWCGLSDPWAPDGSDREGERRGAGTCGPAREKRGVGRAQMNRKFFDLFNLILNYFELFCSKGGPTKLQKFQIKYGWNEFGITNNFSYRNFSRFEKEFELKFREVRMSRVSIEIHWKFLKLWNLVKFGKQGPGYTIFFP